MADTISVIELKIQDPPFSIPPPYPQERQKNPKSTSYRLSSCLPTAIIKLVKILSYSGSETLNKELACLICHLPKHSVGTQAVAVLTEGVFRRTFLRRFLVSRVIPLS